VKADEKLESSKAKVLELERAIEAVQKEVTAGEFKNTHKLSILQEKLRKANTALHHGTINRLY
jgi:hypothetical protein